MQKSGKSLKKRQQLKQNPALDEKGGIAGLFQGWGSQYGHWQVCEKEVGGGENQEVSGVGVGRGQIGMN